MVRWGINCKAGEIMEPMSHVWNTSEQGISDAQIEYNSAKRELARLKRKRDAVDDEIYKQRKYMESL